MTRGSGTGTSARLPTDIRAAGEHDQHAKDRLGDDQVDATVGHLSMLAEPTRLRLLWALRDGECGVTALAEAAGCTPTAASQHLAKMRMSGLVATRAQGRARIYRLAGGHVLRLLTEALAHADHALSGQPHHA